MLSEHTLFVSPEWNLVLIHEAHSFTHHHFAVVICFLRALSAYLSLD